MKYPKDDPRGYKPRPRNDGKFVLDGKRVEFSDYGGSSKEIDMQHPKDVKGSDKPKSLLSIPVGQRYTTIINRLDDIVDVVGHLESDVSDLDSCYSDVVPRLDAIELEVEVMNKVVTKNALALCEIEERIAIMQEKIDGID